MEILGFKNFSFTYSGSDRPVLKNIDLSVESGEILLLYGASGCGKTTLLSLIKEETAPKGKAGGEISRAFLGGEAGFVFQNPEMQLVTDKVWHELAFACENRGWSSDKIRRRVGETASYFGLQTLFRHDTATLSGGQKQLLNLAAVTVTEPKILLLDEPTAQLDPIAAESFMNTVRRMNQELGITFILCEHNTENAFSIAHRAAYMEDGEIKAVLPPREFGHRLLGKPMFAGLPCSVQIGAELAPSEELPLTAGEAAMLLCRYGNEQYPPETPRRAAEEVVAELKNVSFRYEKNGAEVLRGINLRLHRGEILSVLGGNGTGKSTLLSVMSGLLRPVSGRVMYRGRSLKSFGAALYRENIAFLPQNPQDCFTRDTLREDWEHMAEISGFGDFSALAVRLGLDGLMDSHPYDLSGGEQQKAALGKVLMRRPALLLLDEPGKGLDAVNKAELKKILRSLASEGTAVVIVTHDTVFAAEISCTCAMLFDGELISCAPPEEFFGENIFYTTPAARISRGIFKNAVTAEKIVGLCRLNGERDG